MKNENRYIRQILLDKVGELGQEKLSKSKVAVVGCGGLGSIAAPYLAGAGVGEILLIDGDYPDITNLHRQVFFTETEKRSKSEALKAHLLELNSDIKVKSITERLSKSNIAILNNYDLVLECTDHIYTKYLVNDYCALNEIPVSYGAIHKYDGYVSFFKNESIDDIHLRDAFPEINEDIPTCSEVGVLGTLAGIIGLMQANEAIKYLGDFGDNLNGKMWTFNILNADQMTLKLKKVYAKEMSEVFNSTDYKEDTSCNSLEVHFHTLKDTLDNYTFVSVLEDYEHRSLTKNTVRVSMEECNQWIPKQDQSYIVYCQSGKRSLKFVEDITKKYPDTKILSLKRGLKGL